MCKSIVRASLAEPVKTRSKKHEFSASNSCLRDEKWIEPVTKTEKQDILSFVYGLYSAPAGSEPVKAEFFIEFICNTYNMSS
jgi:hypothetical protein